MSNEIKAVADKAIQSVKEQVLKQYDEQSFAKVEADYLSSNQDLLQHLDDMQEVYDLLSDDASKKQYENFLTYQLVSKVSRGLARVLNQNVPDKLYQGMVYNLKEVVKQKGLKLPDVFPCPVVEQFGFEQYVYPPYMNLNKDDVFIDCGACYGDTAMWAAQKCAEVHAFEPIGYVYKGLMFFLDINDYMDVHCYNLGVASKTQELTFKMSKQLLGCAYASVASKQSKFQENYFSDHPCVLHDIKVQCVSLDNFLQEKGIAASFIKMDIEGAELDALHGAAETIKQRKPKLAISLYHSDADLWTIPQYIKSLVPEYKLYCRQNSTEHEFVLYATV